MLGCAFSFPSYDQQKTKTMNRDLLRFLFLLLTVFSLAACGDDDDGDGEVVVDANNTNKNISSNTSANSRLEYPRLKGGNSIVVVHSTDDYGENFAVEWDCDKKAQRWTCYEMYESNSVSHWNRSNWYNTDWHGDPFQEDTSIPEQYRTTLEDYRGSGFNRGHICPSADRLCSKEVNEQTYYLSNMQPQWYNFNAGIWLDMENRVRKWNTSTTWNGAPFRDTLYVCKGGTIDTSDGIKQYTSSGLIVPRYFFMAVLCKNQQGYKAIAFWVEHLNEDHSGEDLRDYAISIDELERKTGIDFFCNLPDATEAHVEATMSTRSWSW